VAAFVDARRGIVTILDSTEDAVSAGLLRHGIVTIVDVSEVVAASTVAAAN
jgi:hypothetical protein